MTSREARARGRAKMDPARRSEIARIGGLARAAKLPKETIAEFGRRGGKSYAARTSPERRSEIARAASAASIAKSTYEQRAEKGRKGGLEASRRRREALQRELDDSIGQ